MKALVWDFDGTILDSEVAVFEAWQETFVAFGGQLSLETWLPLIGTYEVPFDPVAHLEQQLGYPINRTDFMHQQQTLERAKMQALDTLPGVRELIAEAHSQGLALAIASSSGLDWVGGHLERLGLQTFFKVLRTRENVARTKPDPALYVQAVEALGLAAHQCLAIEDSLHGVRAARAAGLWTLAVPGRLTQSLDFSEAHRQQPSLQGVSLDQLRDWFRG